MSSNPDLVPSVHGCTSLHMLTHTHTFVQDVLYPHASQCLCPRLCIPMHACMALVTLSLCITSFITPTKLPGLPNFQTRNPSISNPISIYSKVLPLVYL